MLYYDRIDISQRIGVNKTSESRVWYLSLLVFFKWGIYVSIICMQ